jgi:15-cis-phytoene synthase
VNALVRQGYRKARTVTRQHARSFSLASLLLFGARRRAAFALYAFCRRLDDLVDREDGGDGSLAERLSRARALIASLYREAPHLADSRRGPVEARAASIPRDHASDVADPRRGPVEARAASIPRDHAPDVSDPRRGPVEARAASIPRDHASDVADPRRGPVEARAASIPRDQDHASDVADPRRDPVEARAASIPRDHAWDVVDPSRGPAEARAASIPRNHASDVADPSRGPVDARVTSAAQDRAQGGTDLRHGPVDTRAPDALSEDAWDVAELAALRDTIDRFGVPEQPFQDLVSGMEMDVAGHRYATFADLELYCDRVAGTVGLLLCPVLGASDPRAQPAAADLGRAMQLTNILRDVREDLARGRVYLPEDELAAFGLTRDDLLRGTVDDRWRAFMASQIARARVYYARAATGVRWLSGPGTQRMVKLMGALYGGILGDIEARGYDVFSARAHVPPGTKLRTVVATLLRPRTLLPPPADVPAAPLLPRGAS